MPDRRGATDGSCADDRYARPAPQAVAMASAGMAFWRRSPYGLDTRHRLARDIDMTFSHIFRLSISRKR